MSLAERNGDAKRSGPGVITLAEMKRSKTEWLWPGRVPRAALTILEGRKGTGKSTVAAALVADVTGGRRMGRGKKRLLGAALWLSVEEDYSSTIAQRLEAAGAPLNRIIFPHAPGEQGELRKYTFPADSDALQSLIEERGVVLAILDPWTSFVDSQFSVNDEQGVRGVLEPLARVAKRTRCALVLIRHLRKSGNGPALDQGMGSAAIGNVARSILRVDRREPDRDRRYLAHVACNLAQPAPTLTFSVRQVGEAARVEWEGESSLTAEQLAEGQGDAGERCALADAKAFLRAELDEGPKLATDLKKKGDAMGISPATLRRARAALNVQPKLRHDGGERHWYWHRPAQWPAEQEGVR